MQRVLSKFPGRLFRLGTLGMWGLYCCFCCVVASRRAADEAAWGRMGLVQTLVLYRMPILCVTMGWLWTVSVAICAHHDISVKRLFHRRVPDHTHVRNSAHLASVFTIIVAWGMILRARGDEYFGGAVLRYCYVVADPVGVHLISFGLMICPLRMVYAEERWGLCFAAGRTLTAPLHSVAFSDVIFADALTSMSRGLSALEALFCVSTLPSGSPGHLMHCSTLVLAALMIAPYWWRLQQCLRKYRDSGDAFPHLANAAKYGTAFPLIIVDRFGAATVHAGLMSVSTQHAIWIACAFVNSGYRRSSAVRCTRSPFVLLI